MQKLSLIIILIVLLTTSIASSLSSIDHSRTESGQVCGNKCRKTIIDELE